ncbi:MAG: hypothetical protein O9309_05345, partial [Rhizobium sp.]|nr:hypothetical protein [Rhizobium sp.]MCZ8349544.1 hypothetical protein [Rhizobium sp.]
MQRRDAEDGTGCAGAGIAASLEDREEEIFAIGRRAQLQMLAGSIAIMQYIRRLQRSSITVRPRLAAPGLSSRIPTTPDVVQQGFLGAAETDLMVGIAWDEIYGAAQKHALLAGYGDALRRVLCV